MVEPTVRVGVNVFCWRRTVQNHVIVQALLPSVTALRTTDPAWFWLDRHDARGPHVMALITVPVRARKATVRDLDTRLTACLRDVEPSGLDRSDIETRHDAARRQPLCAPDRVPGLADENTFVRFEQPNHGFPFVLTHDLDPAASAAIWEHCSALTLWTAEQLAKEPIRPRTGLGLRWLAGFDAARERVLPGTAPAFWRYFACSLLGNLNQRLTENEAETLRAINRAVGERNRLLFANIWQTAAAARPPWEGVDDLWRALAAAQEMDQPTNTWRLSRTLAHCALKQLGLYQQDELPAVLFAFHRSVATTREHS